MTALKDLMSVTRSVLSSPRTAVTVTQNLGAVRRFSISVQRTAPPPPPTRFAACLRRCSSLGIRLVVLAPADTAAFARGISRFPQRRADLGTHVQWETAYRIFCGRGRQAHDRGSWRILAVDRDDRVIGAITARFFCGEVQPQYLHVLSLLDDTGPVFREHCELAVSEVMGATSRAGRTPAEISHWAVAPVWHAGWISATLVRAMKALVAAFDAPVIVMAADNRRSEVNRLMRLGSVPLSLQGHSCLPPFVHHESGAWLRLLVLDAAKVQARGDDTSAVDLALLRERASIISAG
jgi:hypothetical protein